MGLDQTGAVGALTAQWDLLEADVTMREMQVQAEPRARCAMCRGIRCTVKLKRRGLETLARRRVPRLHEPRYSPSKLGPLTESAAPQSLARDRVTALCDSLHLII